MSDTNYLDPTVHKSWWSFEKMRKSFDIAGFKKIYRPKREVSKCSIFSQDYLNYMNLEN